MYLDRRGAPPEAALPPVRYVRQDKAETAGTR